MSSINIARMSIQFVIVRITIAFTLSALTSYTAIAAVAEEGGRAPGEACQSDLETPAPIKFDRLVEYNGQGWREFDAKDINTSLRNLQQAGRRVALLVNDLSSRSGKNLVYGYIYKITPREVPAISTTNLTRQERRQLKWQALWQSSARVTLTEWTLHLTTTPPQITQDENGALKNLGWGGNPPLRTVKSIKHHDVIAGKFEL